MASISEALRYMAERESELTQRQRQGMQFALSLAQFEAEKAFKERQFQRDVFQTTLNRQYELNEQAISQSVGNFSSKVASMADSITGYNYADYKKEGDFQEYQKRLIQKGHFTQGDANAIMSVLSGLYSESEQLQRSGQDVAAQLATRLQRSYKAASELQAVDADPTVKPWVDVGIVGGQTREERAANDMMMRNIAGSIQNRDFINQEFLDMVDDDFEMDTDLYEMASAGEEIVAQTTTSTIGQLPESAADRLVFIKDSLSVRESDRVDLEARLNELNIKIAQGVQGLDDEVAKIQMDIRTADEDLIKLRALEPATKTEVQADQLIKMVKKGGYRRKIQRALDEGLIDDEQAERLTKVGEKAFAEKWDKLFTQKDGFVY